MDESLKLLTKSDLRKGFKIYLQNNDYSKKSINTYSSQALFLYDRLGVDKFWGILQSNYGRRKKKTFFFFFFFFVLLVKDLCILIFVLCV